MKIYDLKSLDFFSNKDFSWTEDKDLISVVQCLSKEWRFVGGCVRDSLLGMKTYDIDITTLLEPEEIIRDLSKFNISTIGQKFGTIGVFLSKYQIEITTARLDIRTYGRKADVQFIKCFKEDSARRDFTINALMLKDNKIFDYHHGIEHLQEKKIIFVGDANTRIKEDYLRIIRYIRFFVRFSDVKKEIDYREVLENHLDGLKNVSIERIINEIYKMSEKQNFFSGIQIMNEIKLSQQIFGQDLYIPKNQEMNNSYKFMSVFLFLENLKNLPMQKNYRKLLLFTQCNELSIEKNISIVWNKTKDTEKTIEVIRLLEIKNNTQYTHMINKMQKPCDFPLSQNLEGKTRGEYELIQRYLHLSEKRINLDCSNIKDIFCDLFEKK